MMKNKKKLTKIILGSIGIGAIACIIPACVVSCGSSSSTATTPAASTNSAPTNNSTSTPATPDVGNTVLSAMVTPSTSGLKGIQYQTNEFGFGSSVTLNAKFNEPKLNLTTGQKATVSVTYSWFANNSTTPIKDATSNSYVINLLNEDTTYQVNASYTITITDGSKTINTIKNTVSDAIKLSVNNADLHVNLSYGNNQTGTITDYGSQTFVANIYAVFGDKSTDQLSLTPSDFPTGYSLVFQELDVPNTKIANDLLPSPVPINGASSLNTTFSVNQSYPIAVNLEQNSKVITASNAINVCGYVKTDGSIDLNSTVPTTTKNSGLSVGNNTFAFGSQVTLKANFTQPVFDLGPNQAIEMLSTIYSWTINGKTITNTNNTYTINQLFADSSYSVAITYMYQVINSKTKTPLANPVSGTLTYSKNINLNVDFSNVKFVLNASNLNKNNQITSFGYQSLSTSLEVSFDNNKTYVPLNASDFVNLDYKISFGTLTDIKFNAFTTNDAANSSSWTTSYIIENSTQLQAQITIDNNNTIKSNVIATDIINPSVGLSASLSTAKNAVGKQITSNEFAFGSQVQLTADFAHPAINSGSGISTTSNITYTWYKNGEVIKGATASSYTISYILISDTYSVSVAWNWSITNDNTSAIKISNLEAINQTYKSANLNLTVDNSNMSFSLVYGNNQTTTITSNNPLTLTPLIKASFGDNTITIPTSALATLTSWSVAYQRYAFNQWNTLSTINLNASTITYNYNPTGIYPIQAVLSANGKTFTSNMIQVNTTYNGDVLDLANIPTSLQSKYNCLSFIKDYINISMEGEGDNSPFMQQATAWTQGYKLVQNAKPTSDEQFVPVSPVDLSNIQVNWTNPNNKEDGVIVSATIANSNGLSLMTWNNGKFVCNDPGSITLNQGDIIKWLLPFGTSQLAWSVTNGQASASLNINLSLTPNVFTSLTKNGQVNWYLYLNGIYSLPGIDTDYWGFTVETANGTNVLTNAIKNNSWYQSNISNDTQWIVYGEMLLLNHNENSPSITFNSNTSSYAQALYEASIAWISSLK